MLHLSGWMIRQGVKLSISQGVFVDIRSSSRQITTWEGWHVSYQPRLAKFLPSMVVFSVCRWSFCVRIHSTATCTAAPTTTCTWTCPGSFRRCGHFMGVVLGKIRIDFAWKENVFFSDIAHKTSQMSTGFFNTMSSHLGENTGAAG